MPKSTLFRDPLSFCCHAILRVYSELHYYCAPHAHTATTNILQPRPLPAALLSSLPSVAAPQPSTPPVAIASAHDHSSQPSSATTTRASFGLAPKSSSGAMGGGGGGGGGVGGGSGRMSPSLILPGQEEEGKDCIARQHLLKVTIGSDASVHRP